jgi:hypothetical protein
MKISATTSDEFEEQFTKLLKQEASVNITSIVYFWRVENEIPRLIGKSNILYIGKTSKSLQERYLKSANYKIEKQYFENIYRHAIKEYGQISIEIIKTDNPAKAEYEALNEYYKSHCEHPPLNRSIPNPPKAT